MKLAAAVPALNHLAAVWLSNAASGLTTVIVLGAICISINRFLSPALRCWLWWLICARLAFGAVGGIVGLPQITIPVSLPTFANSVASQDGLASSSGDAVSTASLASMTSRRLAAADTGVVTEPQSLPMQRPGVVAYLFLLWGIGALASFFRLGRESLDLHRSLASGRDLSASALASDVRELAARMGIASPPRIVELPEISSPFVASWRQPLLVIPTNFEPTLSHEELQMALAHELAHLRRGDLYFAVVPMVARALCFCVPFVPAFACSEWATAREADCDLRAMAATATAPAAYSRLLIKIVRGDVKAHRAPRFTLGATASFQTLQARLRLIRESAETRRLAPGMVAVFVLVVACVLLPWRAGRSTTSAALAPLAPIATPEDAKDVADVPAFATYAENDPDKRYILIGARASATPPSGYRLLIVLPGGDGGADFNYFVRRLRKQAFGDNYLIAELVAKQWDARQAAEIVWPTRTNPWPSMRFSTEQFAESVVRDVEARFPIDRRHVFTLSWASGGPAGYALSLASGTPIAGSFIAMSTFSAEALPSLNAAHGHAYYLLHPHDAVIVPLSVAQNAERQLRQNGAAVQLVTYPGGYGWNGDVYGQVRRGVEFLEDNISQ